MLYMKTNDIDNKTKLKAFSIRMPHDLADKIDLFAEENHWSRNTAIRILLCRQLGKVAKATKRAVNE